MGQQLLLDCFYSPSVGREETLKIFFVSNSSLLLNRNESVIYFSSNSRVQIKYLNSRFLVLPFCQAMASSSASMEKFATRSLRILKSLGHRHFQTVFCQGLPLSSKRKGDKSSVNLPSADFDCWWFRNHLILGRLSTV